MMQLLALTAMEAPSQFETGRVRDEKVKVFRSLRPFPVEKRHEYIVLGQYGPGKINGKPVPGYRKEPDINPDSLTPTFAEMKVFIEKVLIDCMLGDQMLFWRQDGLEHCWSFLTPILNECETCGNRSEILHFYEFGSWGPRTTSRI